jgi:hypothetical protein
LILFPAQKYLPLWIATISLLLAKGWRGENILIATQMSGIIILPLDNNSNKGIFYETRDHCAVE